MHYYQHNIKDYSHDTAHLTLEEDAIYRRLIDYYYETESPIPKKTQRVIRRLRLGSYENLVDSILDEFFYLDGDEWRHKRIDYEIEVYRQKADVSRANGKKGGRPKGSQNKPKANPEETQTKPTENPLGFSGFEKETQTKANQEPITINQEPITNLNNMSGTPDDAHQDEIQNSKPKRKRKPTRPHKQSAIEILSYLNDRAGRNYEPVDTNLKLIEKLLTTETRTPELIRQVIDHKADEWGSSPKMSEYLRPKTLFAETNFAQYVGSLGAKSIRDKELDDWINGRDVTPIENHTNTFEGVFAHVPQRATEPFEIFAKPSARLDG